MLHINAYREILDPQIGVEKTEEDDGKKLKPSDTAVGIALKSDRQALSEKQFTKLLKKSVFENFSQRFGVSDETQEKLGSIYFTFEEREAKAEEADLEELKSVYKLKKEALERELFGCGKEARKLIERFEKNYRTLKGAVTDKTNLSYAEYEDEIKRFMVEYEFAVSADGASAEKALKDYGDKIEAVFNAHRKELADCLDENTDRLNALAAEYTGIAAAFHKTDEIVIVVDESDEYDEDVEEETGEDE